MVVPKIIHTLLFTNAAVSSKGALCTVSSARVPLVVLRKMRFPASVACRLNCESLLSNTKPALVHFTNSLAPRKENTRQRLCSRTNSRPMSSHSPGVIALFLHLTVWACIPEILSGVHSSGLLPTSKPSTITPPLSPASNRLSLGHCSLCLNTSATSLSEQMREKVGGEQ